MKNKIRYWNYNGGRFLREGHDPNVPILVGQIISPFTSAKGRVAWEVAYVWSGSWMAI